MSPRTAKAGLALVATLVATSSGAADPFVRAMGSTVALTHVRVIDGSGAPGKDNQTVVIAGGRITGIGNAAVVRIPAGATTLDLAGRTVIPGLVGMHDHLFYQLEPPSGTVSVLAQSTFAKLYLASGVTTIRTAGTLDFDGDADLKRRIDAGAEPGPKIHLTGPYLNAVGAIPDPDRIAKEVATYADRGATSFKAYTGLRASELKAAIDAAHARGLTVTGHLCAVGFREAASMGIDNLEHGLTFDSGFYSQKHADECPKMWDVFRAVVDAGDVEIRRTIETLVRRGVAITSTLAVLESYAMDQSSVDPRLPLLMTARLRNVFQEARDRRKDPQWAGQSSWGAVLRKEMQFERWFVNAGGKLMAGADPTGWGGVAGGWADQRGVELLVSAGFTPEGAIKIATANGAAFLPDRTVGEVVAGKQADLVILRGDPSLRVSDIRNVELVFKDGIAYEPDKLIAAAAGTLSAFDLGYALRRNFWPITIVLMIIVGRRVIRRLHRPPAAARQPHAPSLPST
jgi:imidazolonepropionase-like amidohydrolase